MANRTVPLRFRVFIFLAGLAFAGGCSPRTGPVPEPALETSLGDEGSEDIPRNLTAIVRSGGAPLWFELRADGPAPIPGPADAQEEPFAPWPQARHVAGFAAGEDGRLIMAVNRDGFLAWEPRKDGLGLYRVSGREAWDPYTAASLFMYRGTPAVLLYGDDFFSPDGTETPDPPAVRVWGLGTDFQEMEETEIPAFAVLPQAEGWDVDTLSPGKDGFWYYRGVRRGAAPEIRYFRTRDLALPGEPSSAGVFRNAMSPYTEKDMPRSIRAALEEAERMTQGEKNLVAAVVSPEFPARRHFALRAGNSGEREVLEIAGFYRPPDTAAVIFPGGQGIFAGQKSAGPLSAGTDVSETIVSETIVSEAFTLPVLPEGFVYTRIGFAGPVLIAAWEEQQDWRIGAAGFMVIDGP